MSNILFNSIKLVKGGTIQGDDRATGSLTTSDTYYNFGGVFDLWGLSLTKTDVESSNFGVAISFAGDGYLLNNTSNYLVVTNFGISLPSGAVINGVEVRVEGLNVQQPSLNYNADVDHVQINVYYTIQNSTSISSSVKSSIVRTETSSLSTKSNIIRQTQLISPLNSTEGLLTYLVWTIPSWSNSDLRAVFQVQVDDTDNTFSSLEHDLDSRFDSNFEYYNGSSWVSFPTNGVASTYFGNQARVQVSLSEGTKYWRVRAGVS